jgi:hypothetical protein
LNETYEPEGARMYATGTHICSVASFTKYIFNLHKECDVLWQRPTCLFDEDGEWCEKKTLGKNTLAIIMTNISRKAYLSKHDTNHCVRATCITVLREACFEARQIVTACLFYCIIFVRHAVLNIFVILNL